MKTLILTLIATLTPGLVMAQTAEEKGLAIATEADRRDSGWGDSRASLRMILRNRHGSQSIREMRNRVLEMKNDGDKTLIVFDHPRDVKGTAFLSFSHATRPDDQWLYLPALKRVKRISSSNKSGPFMGSEFAYEDIGSQEVAKYRHIYLGDARLGDREVFKIQRIPTYEYSGYTRQIVWLDKQMYQPLKIEFYDRKNSLLKTLTFSGYKQYLGRYWRPSKMDMVNHQTGKRTTLIWKRYRFRTGLKESDFTRNSLKRIR